MGVNVILFPNRGSKNEYYTSIRTVYLGYCIYARIRTFQKKEKIRISDILKMGEIRIQMKQKSRHLVNCETENESSSGRRKRKTMIYRINHW